MAATRSSITFWGILAIAGVILLSVLVLFELSDLGKLCFAIILGGTAGGFTLALIGGESYGLKIPGLQGIDHGKLDPGFLGDIFVGLMAACLGVGLGIWADLLKVSPFEVPATTGKFFDRWFANFGMAYVCGFLGLKLIKAISIRVFKEAALEESVKKTALNEIDNLYSRAQDLIRNRQYDHAEELLHHAQSLEGDSSIRALIGLGRCQKRLGKFGDAIATLDRAIALSPKVKEVYRVPVAYWNRACYKTLAHKDSLELNLPSIISDLQEALRLQESFRFDLKTEEDLKALHGNRIFEELAAGKTA